MKIKKMKWRAFFSGFCAEGLGCSYGVDQDEKDIWFFWVDVLEGGHMKYVDDDQSYQTAKDAMKAAQKDFEARIRAWIADETWDEKK